MLLKEQNIKIRELVFVIEPKVSILLLGHSTHGHYASLFIITFSMKEIILIFLRLLVDDHLWDAY
jgi:hypothetical protein